MKELLTQYAAYHAWANTTLLKIIEALPEEAQQAPRPGSFPSLYKTVLHLLDAESMWWQRLKLQERVERPAMLFPEALMSYQRCCKTSISSGRNG